MPRVKGRPLKRAGRPKAITIEQLHDLERATTWGWSVKEACAFADIAQSTFFDYQRKHPDFRRKLSFLREYPVLAAKRVVAEAVANGDVATSRWFLERRSEEFRPGRGRPAAGDVVGDEVLRAAMARLTGRR